MSNTDSFINEVTEEVRRDRLFAYFRKYGWIGLLLVVAVVGGTAWSEWTDARTSAAAQEFGDALSAAITNTDTVARIEALAAIDTFGASKGVVRDLLIAGDQAQIGRQNEAIEILDRISSNGDLPEIYRQIAAFKSLMLQSESMSVEERRLSFERLAASSTGLRTLAAEQLILIDIELDEIDSAIERLQDLRAAPDAGPNLQQRAGQAILALGGKLDVEP